MLPQVGEPSASAGSCAATPSSSSASCSSGGGGLRAPNTSSRRGLLSMVRQVRAEKAAIMTIQQAPADGESQCDPRGAGTGEEAAAAARTGVRQKRERLALAAERRLGLTASGD